MRRLPELACLLVLVLVLGLAEEQPEQRYTTKYDNVDVDAIVRNERLLNGYVGCLLDKKPCTPEAAELKARLPDALESGCSRCSEAQRRISDKLSQHLIDHRPAEWSELEKKYDPSGAYRERYLHTRETEPLPEDRQEDRRAFATATP